MKQTAMRKFCLSALAFTMLSMALTATAQKSKATDAPNYSKTQNWARLPEKISKVYDVFYVHPTTYMSSEDGTNASLSNKKVNAATDQTVERQATVFEPTCNIFAPRYRQASIKVLGMSKQKRDDYLSVGVIDMHKAFTYYMKHYNKGRPFILASHSQGSNVTLNFLRKYRSLINADRLIAVYMIGWTVTKEDLEKIKLPLAETADQTGAIIIWNTIGKNGKSPVLSKDALCVNPLNWKTDHSNQPKSKNIYARILLKNGKYLKIPHFTSAQIGDNGGLIIPAPSIINKLMMEMGPEVYHGYDYDFFYGNLVENAKVRCKAWQKKNSTSK
ncbi:MAG: DUF3089 domain-containing protein [Lentisphaerae bacterium]|nr:DUF3089 domain-containing protein [Lentisphaerota bacterium]MCP4102137.1 DUF3089 domain-containing protein [Lentisphaerota bacterium]